MRLGAHVGVRDEIELIDGCIARLRANGVDHILIVDAGSTDGTVEAVERYRGDGDVQLEHLSDEEPDDEEKNWLRRNLEMAQAPRCDWTIFLDADELWFTARGSLKASLASFADQDVVRVPRYNVPLGPHGAWLPPGTELDRPDELWLITEPIPDFRGHLLRHPLTPWIRGVPQPKIMARTQRIGSLADGMHAASPAPGEHLRQGVAQDIFIAHLPFTTLPRFLRKLANVRRMMRIHDAYFSGSLAWHWRRWLELDDQGAVQAEFERQIMTRDELELLHRQSVVRTAADLFAGSEA